MNRPPGARLRVGLSALAGAEFFTGHERNQDVLLFIDTTSSVSRAGSKPALTGQRRTRSFSRRGSLPKWAISGAHHLDQERFYHFCFRRFTSGGRRPHPAPINVRAFGFTIVLERSIAELEFIRRRSSGIDIEILAPEVLKEHYNVARGAARNATQRFAGHATGMNGGPRQADRPSRAQIRALNQPFHARGSFH